MYNYNVLNKVKGSKMISGVQNTQNIQAYKDNFISNKKPEESLKEEESVKEVKDLKIDTEAVSVQISMQNVLTYINENSNTTAKTNFNAQNILDNLIGGNKDFMNFLSGGKTSEGFSLASIGYEGKPISELSVDEAKELVSEDNGFFGVEKTSQRVSDFAINLSGNSLENLQEARKGIVQGFEEANKLFGGELPEISYRTQEKTLALIDEKIAELSGGAKEEQKVQEEV